MKFPKVLVKRPKDIDIIYWIKPSDILIFDARYEYGNIHNYKKIKTDKAENLGKVLEDYLGYEELDAGNGLVIYRVKRALISDFFEDII